MVRRAREADRDAVLGFASRTWDDWDYVPHAWPRWLGARDGVLLVGTTPIAETVADAAGAWLEPGRPVAVVRVALPSLGEAWLEAIRVDPRVRGMDVATDLQVAQLHWAAANHARIVRYATSARNEGSHRLGARGRFEHVATFRATWWSPGGETGGHRDDEPSGFLPEVQAEAQHRRRALLAAAAAQGHVATAKDGDRLWRALVQDASFRAGERLYEPRPWALEELSRAKFLRHLADGEVLTHGPEGDGTDPAGGDLAIAILVAEVEPAEDSGLRLALLAGDPEAAFELLEDCRARAGEPIRFRYPEGAPLVDSIAGRYRDAGYHFPEWALHVLARPLDADHPAPALDDAVVQLAEPPEATIVPPR